MRGAEMRERRAHVRKKIYEQLMVYDRLINQSVGRVVNMSVSGIMLVSEDPVELPCIFSCRAKLPRKINGNDKLVFDAQAKWCRFNSLTGLYETGYRFLNLTPENEKLIFDILQDRGNYTTEMLHPREFILRPDL
jgi:hypothetical protein